MAPLPWLRLVEAWAVQALLRSPTFHRAVEKVARRVHRLRHGIPPDELGGTRLDTPEQHPRFMRHFVDEVKTQLGASEQAPGAKDVAAVRQAPAKPGNGVKDAVSGAEDADSVWQQHARSASAGGTNGSSSSGFLGEYLAALREQVRSSKGK